MPGEEIDAFPAVYVDDLDTVPFYEGQRIRIERSMAGNGQRLVALAKHPALPCHWKGDWSEVSKRHRRR